MVYCGPSGDTVGLLQSLQGWDVARTGLLVRVWVQCPRLKLKSACGICQFLNSAQPVTAGCFGKEYTFAALRSAAQRTACTLLSAGFIASRDWGNDPEKGQSQRPTAKMVRLKHLMGIFLVISYLNLIKFSTGF